RVSGPAVQSSNTFSDPDHNGNNHLKRRYLMLGGNYNYQYQNQNQYIHIGNTAQHSHHLCHNYIEYNTLMQLKDNNSCLRSTDVWPLLEALSEHNTDEAPKCRVHAIHLLSDAFGNIDTSPDYCHCHGNVHISHFPNRDHDIFQNCLNTGQKDFQKIYNEYYSDVNSLSRQCTHHHVWHLLSQITDVHCQRNLIINLADTFKHYIPEFECSQVSSVHQSTHHVDVTTSTPTTTHAPETTTIHTPQTTQTRAIQTCDKYETISNLAHGTILSHPAASDCSPSDHRASEAFVFQLCHTNNTNSWIKGASVLDNCSQIPLYTPVATFIQDSFISNGGQAGIFLGCLPNGFKMAAQECFANATVLHIEKGGLYTRDPSLYHVVLF
ncbi:hypothetical protein ACJMK2_013204, partial [Sinanodonta woodiana]